MTDKEILQRDLDENDVFQGNFRWEFDQDISDNFVEWFVQNGKHFDSSITAMPDDMEPDQTTGLQCFHNSQLLSQKYPTVKYYEGIMFGPEFKSCVHHGFNLVEKNTVDVTFIFNLENFLNEEIRDTRYIYFGVHIPDEFINKYDEKISNANVQNPILLDYFNSLSA